MESGFMSLPVCVRHERGDEGGAHGPEDGGAQQPRPDELGLVQVRGQELLQEPLACRGDAVRSAFRNDGVRTQEK
ncbi:hypothetical protein EYF80_037301 [Liparis tanakae]|uniref:Uncharacterized protein n=1 Tax=Liparis tanakae TaxID=230148 RepID=A0A4Z2GID8_9TELE|nr:hypothetical protein EYF80_037301 [Liparis tanakae]